MDALSGDELRRCCGSSRWAERMLARQPFSGFDDLLEQSDEVWWSLEPADWLEAFTQHPRIGGKEALRQKWASQEQAGAAAASEEVLDSLAEGNAAYEKKYGHIFIVCATGKTAPEMLAILRERMKAGPEDELRAAAGEQAKITRIRLEKLLKEKK